MFKGVHFNGFIITVSLVELQRNRTFGKRMLRVVLL